MNRLSNLFLFVISFFVSIFLADFLIGKILNVPSHWPIVRTNAAFFPSKSLKPNLDTTLHGAYHEFSFHLRTDAQGFRISSEPSDCRGLDILFLGDSQTLGIGVNDDFTLPSLVAKRMNVCVLNAACHGYSNVEELFLAKRLLAERKPSVAVLCFFTGNDPYENLNDERYLGGETEGKVGAPSALHRAKQFLVERSAMYNLLKRLRKYKPVNAALRSMGVVEEVPPGELLVFNEAEKNLSLKEWKIIEDVLKKMNLAAQETHTKLVVLLIPDRLQVEASYWNQWVEKYKLDPTIYDRQLPNKKLAEICQTMNVPFFDSTAALLASYKKGEKPYWQLDSHLSGRGNEVLSEAFSSYLLALLTSTDKN